MGSLEHDGSSPSTGSPAMIGVCVPGAGGNNSRVRAVLCLSTVQRGVPVGVREVE